MHVYQYEEFHCKNNRLYPFWSIWNIWDLSCWNIQKIIRKFVILVIINSKIFLYMRKVSLERYYCVLYDGALPLKLFFKMVLNPFCDNTLHMFRCGDPSDMLTGTCLQCAMGKIQCVQIVTLISIVKKYFNWWNK